MKIKDIITGEEIDTDKLSDISSELLELVQKNYETFSKYKVPFLMVYLDPQFPKNAPSASNFNDNLDDLHRVMRAINALFVAKNLPYKLIKIE